MKQYEFSAKNVQDAISKGLKELGKNQEDVDIKIVSEGGLFAKAKILIITNEEEIVEEVKEVVEAPVKKEAPKQEVVEKVEAPKQKKEKTQKKQDTKLEEKASVTFIKTLASKLDATSKMEVSEEENILVELNGENAGSLIGYRGEGLSAIQYLANVIESSREEKENRKRIVLNIEEYKQKREQALISLANRMARKAIKTGRSQRLEPMNAYDRRIIHSALTDEAVTTYSKGEEPRRFLVIDPKR